MCLAEENPAVEFNIQKPENSMFTFCDDSIGSYDCSSVNSTPENLTDLDDPESEGSFLGNENEAPLSSTPRIKIYGSNNYHNFIMHSLHMSPILPHDATIISKTACDGNWTQEENTLNGTDDILADTIIEVTDYFFSVSSQPRHQPLSLLTTPWDPQHQILSHHQFYPLSYHPLMSHLNLIGNKLVLRDAVLENYFDLYPNFLLYCHLYHIFLFTVINSVSFYCKYRFI